MYEMTVFSKATMKNKVGVVKALLEAGANPNLQGGLKEIVPISNIPIFIIVPIGIIIPIFIIVPIFIVLIFIIFLIFIIILISINLIFIIVSKKIKQKISALIV